MKTSISSIDEHPAKRVVNGFGAAKRGSGTAFRDKSNLEDQNVLCCNRLGCSTRFNSMRSSIGTSDRSKCSKPSIGSTSGKTKIGSSSKPNSAATDLRKPREGSQNLSAHKETVSAETSSLQIDMEVTECIPSTAQIQTSFSGEAKDAESGILNGFSVDTSEELERDSVVSNSETKKKIHRRCGLGSQDSSSDSSMKSAAPRNVTLPSKSASLVRGANGSRYGPRNLGRKSTSDILPLGSSSHMNRSRRPDLVTNSSDGGCSSDREKIVNGSSRRAPLISQRSSPSRPVLSLSERPPSQQVPRRTIYQSSSMDGVSSIKTKRMVNSKNKARVSEHGESSTVPEMALAIPQLRQTRRRIRGSIPRSSLQQSQGEPSANGDNSYGQSSCSNESLHGSVHPSNSSSIDRDGFERLNMDGIAEVLLALDRIEQDEELTLEQLWILEAHLFVGGLNLHDQHRDMRLDIDNMSYEELLALEEKMGSVSTVLTEDALSNCLKRSCYNPTSSERESKSYKDYDVKCSICQEEYAEGDEVGTLGCNHLYHVVCIHQWLRLKNWCPICKVSAAPS